MLEEMEKFDTGIELNAVSGFRLALIPPLLDTCVIYRKLLVGWSCFCSVNLRLVHRAGLCMCGSFR